MQVTFFGTRGSLPVPGPATLRYGGNTSCVEVRTERGSLIVLDCGTGAFGLGRRIMAEVEAGRRPARGALLISHTHWDHIQGIPFFKPLFMRGFEWDVYAPRGLAGSLRETLCGQMQSAYFPVTLDQLGATVRYHELVEGDLEIGDALVRTQYLNHTALTLGYRIEADGASLVYACDHEPFDRALASGAGEIGRQDAHHVSFLAGADLVIHDAQYTVEEYPARAGWGHSTPDYAIRMARAAGAKRLALTHHDPTRTDDDVDRILRRCRVGLREPGALVLSAAAEGQVLQVRDGAPQAARRASRAASAATPIGAALVGHTVVLGLRGAAETAELSEAIRVDGVKVVAAADGGSVLAAAHAESASLVLVEEELPGIERLDALDTHRTRLAAIVGPRSSGGALKGLDVSDWLERPYSAIYARTRVRAWLLRTACRWMRAPLPDDEDRRLAAVETLKAIAGEPQQQLDEITRKAAALFDVPVALVTLVGGDTQWIKASCGLPEIRQTSREASFCAHLLCRHEPMIVPDTLLDDRFADNPVVVGAPNIRFYAGVPIRTADGSCVGSLCLVDNRPREFRASELKVLTTLGERVEQVLAPETTPNAGAAASPAPDASARPAS